MKRHGKRRCDYCRSDATVWLWYTTVSYPSSRRVRTNAASCSDHESCPNFEGMKQISADRDPVIVRNGAKP